MRIMPYLPKAPQKAAQNRQLWSSEDSTINVGCGSSGHTG
jgi:hypothetical protein